MRLSRALGWMALALFGLARGLEATDWPRRWLQRALSAQLSEADAEFELDGVEFLWLERGLELRGLRCPGVLSIDRLSLTLGRGSPGAPALERVLVDGGELLIGYELERILSALFDHFEHDKGRVLPTLVVHDLAVRLDTQSAQRPFDRQRLIDLGDLRACARLLDDGRFSLEARLRRPREAGAPPEALSISAREDALGKIELRLSGSDLSFSPEYLSARGLESWRALEPSARLGLDASLHFEPPAADAPSAFPRLRAARLRASLRQGRLQLPIDFPAAGAGAGAGAGADAARRIDSIEASFEAQLLPAEARGADWSDPMAWATRLEGSAEWLRQRLTLSARGGRGARPGQQLEAWFGARGLQLDDERRALLGSRPELAYILDMLEPRGEFDLDAAVRIPVGASFADDPREALPMALSVRAADGCSLAYHGDADPAGRRVWGFPLRVEQVRGRLLFAEAGRLDRPFHSALGTFGIAGRSRAGAPISAELTSHHYSKHFLPEEPRGRFSFRLHAESPGLIIDEELGRAFDGLVGVVGRDIAWDDYAPRAGKLPLELDFWQDQSRPHLAMRLQVGIEAARMSWSGLPLALESVEGSLAISTDGRDSTREESHSGMRISARATHAAMREPLRLELYSLTGYRREAADATAPAALQHLADAFRLQITGLNPRHGALRAALKTSMPELEQTLTDLAPQGFFDLDVHRDLPHGQQLGRTLLEIETASGENRIQPANFSMLTSAVEGRVLASLADQGPGLAQRLELFAIPMVGRWGTAQAPIPIGAHVELDREGGLRIGLFGAGISTSNAALLSAMSGALAASRPGAGTELDLSRLGLEGEFDVGGTLRFEGLGNERRVRAEGLQLFLRDGSLSTPEGPDRPLLESMSGRVRIDGSRIGEARIDARLAGTPIHLSRIEFEAGSSPLVIACDLGVRDFAIDREHLAPFLDRPTLRTVLEELEWSGHLSTEGGRLTIALSEDPEDRRVSFRGTLELSQTSGMLGLPVTIRSARLEPLELVLEGKDLRLWTRVRQLNGALADRRLSDVSLLTTYVHPHLSMREFEGRFEGGSLQAIGLEAGGSADFFSLDLAAPFHFRLAAAMKSVDAGELLRGIFNSSFANRGRLDASLALEGDLGQLLSIRGKGHVKLSDSSLWAIPVFQQLFSQLGFDTTAVFKRMECRLAVADGRIAMRDMRLKSDLLSLVGNGEIDFDGRMRHDLDVRYALIDRLGPLTLLLYKIQEGLLHVSIHGDLSRPRVALGGILSLFLGARVEEERELPLPASSPLPRRF